jgi:hypothetical protein
MMHSADRLVLRLTALVEPTLALALMTAIVLVLRQSLPEAVQSFDNLLVVFRLSAACLGRPDLVC